jgi:hypothetical protein
MGCFLKMGTTKYRFESSYLPGGPDTLSSSDEDKDYGSWKIVVRQNQAVLITTSTQTGETSESTLEEGIYGNEILLNGDRYFIRG